MKTRQATIENYGGRVRVERKNALITQYIDRQITKQVVIPEGTDEGRVALVMDKLASGRIYR